MSYPKPLSEKSIEKMYAATGLTPGQIEFIRAFLTACAGLYGVITAGEAWDVYRELSGKARTVRIRRTDLYAALCVLRRERAPFYVFEADEVYSGEPRTDKMRFVALRRLITPGYGKFEDLYSVEESACDKPFFVPANLLEYARPTESPYERRLLELLGRLKATRTEYTRFGVTRPCLFTGKRLGECPIGPAEQDAGAQSGAGITAAGYLVEQFKYDSHIGRVSPADSLRFCVDLLETMGVALNDRQLEELMRACTEMHNNQHLWCNRGWTPAELMGQFRGPRTMTLGPGLQKLFDDGLMDKDELMETLAGLAFTVRE